MIRLYKVAANLKRKGFDKLAQNVIDLAKKRRIKDENARVLKDMKDEDRLSSIEEQHKLDKPSLQNPGQTSEFAYPTNAPTGKRYAVQVQYPSFNESGAPYFDKDSVSEYLTMTEDDLLNYQEQEKQGGVKITSVKPLLPKSQRR